MTGETKSLPSISLTPPDGSPLFREHLLPDGASGAVSRDAMHEERGLGAPAAATTVSEEQ